MDGSSRAPRRSLRDWLVDTAMFCFAVLFGFVLSAWRLQSDLLPEPSWLFDLDQATGVLACAALWLRRRWPVELAYVLIAASTYSELSGGALVVALFTVAVHRGPRTALITYAVSLVGVAGYGLLRPEPDMPFLMHLLFGVTLHGSAIGWGLFIHHRRQLVTSLRDRASRAEAEARLRVEQAQLLAREAIAREMHDVLGHRLSLLSVHAGALEFRPDAPADDVARAATVIRESAHQALQDLREVIGVLRAPVSDLPQPVIGDVPQLVAESRLAGMSVILTEERAGGVPEAVGRTAYRIVQEGLTNVRRHAPGAEVRVRVTGQVGDGLNVEVRNDASPEPPAAGTCPGQGLAGLAERVALAGGRLEHGPTVDGWRLTAWLPWPP